MALPPAQVREHKDGVSQPSAIDRAKKLTAPFGGDDKLDAWTARLIASADDFENRKRPDPFNQFILLR